MIFRESTISKSSFSVSTLKYLWRTALRWVQSIKICLTVKAGWQAWHSGWFSPFRRQEFVSLVWPTRRRLITTLSWRLSDDIFVWWPITGYTLYNLFDVHWLQRFCHFLVHKWLTKVNRSLTGNFISVTGSSSPALAAVSAFSFPLIPTWLGIQQKVTDLPPFVRWVYSSSIFKTNIFSVLRLSIACKLDKESEKTTKSLLLIW